MSQVDPVGLSHFLQVDRIHGAGDHLHFCRMTKNPGDGDRSLRRVVLVRQIRKRFVEFREIRIVDEHSAEHSVLKRRPGLNRNVMKAAVAESSAVPHHGQLRRLVIHVEILINQLGLLQRKLQLVDFQRLPHIFFQKFDLHRHRIADAEGAHLAGGFQLIEGRRHLLRIKQKIRPVKKKHVQILCLQSLKNLIHALDDTVFSPVKNLLRREDTAFGLNDQIFTFQIREREGLRESSFRLTRAVNGGMIEIIDSEINGGSDHLRRGFPAECRHAHTTENQP